MSMSKKDFIALADHIKNHNRDERESGAYSPFNSIHVKVLADFCRSQNANFMRDRWLDYINGECGPNGGAVKPDPQK